MPTRWKLKRIRAEVVTEILKEKNQDLGLLLGLLKWNMCAQTVKRQAGRQSHPQGKAGGPAARNLPFITFDLPWSRQEALMIHSLYILLSISKTSFSKLPIHQQYLCRLSPEEMKWDEPPRLLERVASFMSLGGRKQSLCSCLFLPTGRKVALP